MEFNPLYDYGQRDLRDEKSLAFYNFAELLKTLITLSSSAERQFEIIGYGAVCDEMAIDFDSYFTIVVNQYKMFDLLTDFQIEKLNELDLFLEYRSGEKAPDFWDDFLLDTNPEWEIVRQMAKNILEILEMQHLEIEFERTESVDKNAMLQYTKIILVKK